MSAQTWTRMDTDRKQQQQQQRALCAFVRLSRWRGKEKHKRKKKRYTKEPFARTAAPRLLDVAPPLWVVVDVVCTYVYEKEYILDMMKMVVVWLWRTRCG